MIAKIRMQVGDAVISWGLLPEADCSNAHKVGRAIRLKFAVIEGGRKAGTRDTALPLRAKSA